MSVSPEVLQANGAKPPPGMPSEPPPAAAPMMSPQKPEGKQQDAAVKAQLAMRLLDMAIGAYGTSDDKGAALLKAQTILRKAFGKHEEEDKQLTDAERMMMGQSLAGPG